MDDKHYLSDYQEREIDFNPNKHVFIPIAPGIFSGPSQKTDRWYSHQQAAVPYKEDCQHWVSNHPVVDLHLKTDP